MISLIAVLLFIAVFASLFVFTKRGPEGAEVGHIEEDVWAAARESVSAPLQPLVSLGRRFEALPVVWDSDSTLHRHLHRKLLAAGGLFAGSVEVFLSVQIACLLAAGCCLALGFAGVFNPVAMCALAVVIAVAPYGQIDSVAKRRTAEITRSLPEFAELILIPLQAGLSVRPALEFCAQRTSGPVATEVRNMLTLMQTHAMNDAEAFSYAAARLGTPEARTFFNALYSAHVEGIRVADNLASQANSLRVAMYQQRRAEAKKLPVKLILVFGIHLLPLVFAIALIPAAIALASM